ncbi:universal stress protein [Mycolicibacterium smegmatis]|uniref:Universal stress protein family protein n=3 Tax=Mycolicibacterium smegmatis TaxID=1772 RepID=A0QZ90_MYCS2|nr:universal stress protein [Mycolicibacterium smegmatis]ABK72096.1 universal stress protein family protein [Mycolicibacterium smegmatis MC2 155]AFP40306.1 UspA [Mycolicibacterium smegmatis MC2 155]AIU09053.1 universal stress protein [Mycolicibacterium smegmatis MC2 155]AIU15678.1 universal stress protein [Mycolicibacterium smegmatis]AIU22301.1 universal stress protein [Mycolicibacterium smegmatis]
MLEPENSAPIVVGIDGSEAGVRAARWAAAEAESRNVPLRLVYATKASHPSADDYYDDVRRGQDALSAAQIDVNRRYSEVKVETALVDGPPGRALIDESDRAAMLCVGSVGIGRYAESILGSIALAVAEGAACPVAVIRAQEDDSAVHWIAAGNPADEHVVESAMAEARLRQAPVLVLGDRREGDAFIYQVKSIQLRNPDLHIYPITDRNDVAGFLRRHDEPVQLAVIGESEVAELPRILGPHGRHMFHLFEGTTSSVLVARYD